MAKTANAATVNAVLEELEGEYDTLFPERWIDNSLLKQIPIGHIMGKTRLVIIKSPCCGRRMRIPLTRVDGARQYNNKKRCNLCNSMWQLSLQFTKSGFVKNATLLYLNEPSTIDELC